jgi:hypothetical protein
MKAELGKAIAKLYEQFLLSEPTEWENVKDKVWPNEQLKNENKFLFLQGDIIETTDIASVGTIRSDITQSLWMVLNPSCEMIAGRGMESNRLFRVAPVTQVTFDEKQGKSENSQILQLSYKLKKPNCFPLSQLPGDDSTIFGGFAYLDARFFLEEEKCSSVVKIASLTLEGWHLFGAAIQNATTRANIADEEKIRKKFEFPA